ncbi:MULTISPECIES: LysR family transcriptional regulator [Pseudomonas]|uniref:LysR family transcriptional regulator n=1 Tax=Pseudomonas azadiae TaxID=2843612 RepID=A0ABS6NW96_9PSED|nr:MULTISPECIES: LysR family transcriptional regulator [Pseudomonas]MBV4452500.1 LysR family transcriptional regulator [Pseudomonas azadiae]NMF41892.1 LysR family transcriptional regulator [Pseudomonas sp. SWRI 103]
MISTRQLRYFVEIVDSGSFSAAAERLFVAQSALSRQIKAMETQLQIALFERTARQPRLTAAGEALYPRAAGFGIALLPKSMRDIAPANLHFLPLADPDCLGTVALACAQAPSALVEQFCQTLHECL